MASEFDLTDEEIEILEAHQLVRDTNDADTLVHFVAEEEHHWATRTDAAEKLIKMWKVGRTGRITLDHLAYVGDHADDPHKSEANRIIRDNL